MYERRIDRAANLGSGNVSKEAEQLEAAITYHNLRIKNGFGLYKILNFAMRVEANGHASAKFSGIVSKESAFSEIKALLDTHLVSVVNLEEDGTQNPVPIFTGLTKDVTIDNTSGYYTIQGSLVSGTHMLDRVSKSRSFQDRHMTYQDVIRETLMDTPGAAVIFNMEENPEIGRPLIQYKETDWTFIRRLAGHLGVGIIPEVTLGQPRFWFGMPLSSERVQFSLHENCTYREVVDSKFYAMDGAGYRRSDYYYIDIDSMQLHKIGDRSNLREKELVICGRRAKLVDGELVFTYRLAKPRFIVEKYHENDRITGMTIPGTVLKTQGETLRIHLDIDSSQMLRTAYPYRWTTATGSLFYCMLKIGTRVALYFPDRDERDAYAIHCGRTNSADDCGELMDYNRRYFTTEHQKRFYMFPETMGFVGTSNNETPLQILLSDEMGLLFQSHHKIWIEAEQHILLRAKNASLKAPKEIIITQEGRDDEEEND